MSLGRYTLGFLVATVVSGVVLAALWQPDAARASVEATLAGLPWGWFLRAVHGFAAIGVLVGTVAHLVQVVWKRRERDVPAGAWWRAVAVLPLVVMAMLSGFVMRGDAEARAALDVWRGILQAIPGAGDALATLLLGSRQGGLGPVSLHHAGTFTVAAWLLSGEHGRRLWPDARTAVLTALAAGVVAAVVPLPLGPAEAGPGLATGPWYLLGLQGALLDLPAAVGWVAPAALVLGLGGLRHVSGRARSLLLAFLLALCAAYAAWTVRLLAL